MKTGGFLLALLVTLLSSIPCCSLEECDEEAEEKHSSQEIPGDCEDSCSPFLNCNGCTGFTIQNSPEENNEILRTPSHKISSNQQWWVADGVLQPVWQPPQVS